MTPQQWNLIKGIVAEALEQRVEDRDTYLSAACGGNLALRHEVETLLSSEAEDWSFFDAGPRDWPTALEEPLPRSRAGDRVGPYEILEEIGHGGMGEVYLARRADDEFQKKVAIKLLRPGMASHEALARFRNERQISAALEHPNIARLLDGGTTESGEPYFVMEYVEGESLLQARRGLSLEERLSLFETICGAVEYAHRSLVVHRDIKPSNILVTEDGTPKLLDFGIAKLLDPESTAPSSDHTATVLRVLTPDYASPEQVRGEAITTATDVYSLGVVLYELLAGRRPYHVRTSEVAELLRVVCETEPERPSAAASEPAQPSSRKPAPDSETLPRRLRGDLDAIVMKALRKEPHKRYGSVAQLAEDLRRHREGRPVEARRGTLSYRAGKFVRRHRVGLAAAAVIALALSGGVLATLREARRAQAAEARAQRRFNDVRKLANSFLFEFHDSIKDLAGSTPARELLVRRGLDYLDRLSSEAGNDPSLLRELSDGYRRLGELQGSLGVGSAMLGDMAESRTSFQKSIGLRERLLQTGRASLGDRIALANVYALLSDSFGLDGDAQRSLGFAVRALTLAQAEVTSKPADVGARRMAALAQLYVGLALKLANRYPAALDAFRKGLEGFRALSAADPADTGLRRSIMVLSLQAGMVQLLQEQTTQALASFRDGLLVANELSAREPTNAQLQRDVAICYSNIGDAQLRQRDSSGAEQSFRIATRLLRKLAVDDPASPNPRIWEASSLRDLGNVLLAQGQAVAGRRQLAEAVGILEPIVASRGFDVTARGQLAETYSALGSSHQAGRRSGALEARSWYGKAQSIYLALRQEGKLAPIYATRLSEVNEKIAALSK